MPRILPIFGKNKALQATTKKHELTIVIIVLLEFQRSRERVCGFS
jgi:hypothetical protein